MIVTTSQYQTCTSWYPTSQLELSSLELWLDWCISWSSLHLLDYNSVRTWEEWGLLLAISRYQFDVTIKLFIYSEVFNKHRTSRLWEWWESRETCTDENIRVMGDTYWVGVCDIDVTSPQKLFIQFSQLGGGFILFTLLWTWLHNPLEWWATLT